MAPDAAVEPGVPSAAGSDHQALFLAVLRVHDADQVVAAAEACRGGLLDDS